MLPGFLLGFNEILSCTVKLKPAFPVLLLSEDSKYLDYSQMKTGIKGLQLICFVQGLIGATEIQYRGSQKGRKEIRILDLNWNSELFGFKKSK